MFSCALYKYFYYPQIWSCKQHLLPIPPTLNEGVACEDYQKLYTIFAVIQAPPQYKSHSVLNLIFNALY